MKILHLSIIAVVCITLTTTLFLVMFVTTIPSNAIRTADGVNNTQNIVVGTPNGGGTFDQWWQSSYGTY